MVWKLQESLILILSTLLYRPILISLSHKTMNNCSTTWMLYMYCHTHHDISMMSKQHLKKANMYFVNRL